MSKQCPCGCRQFKANQVLHVDVVVDEENNFICNDSKNGDVSIYYSEDPFGPYICTNCENMFPSLDELVDPDEPRVPEPVDCKELCESLKSDLQLALELLSRLREGDADDSLWRDVDELMEANEQQRGSLS